MAFSINLSLDGHSGDEHLVIHRDAPYLEVSWSEKGRLMQRFWIAVFMVVAGLSGAAANAQYEGHSVIRVTISSMRDLRTMLAVSDDPWSHGVGIGDIDFRVSPEGLHKVNQSGLQYKMLITDVQALIDSEKQRLAQGGVADDDWYLDFKNYFQVYARMNSLAATRPDLVQLLQIGTSVENRPIRALRISTGGNHPAVLFNACQHAREWVSVMVPMYIADTLISQYGVDEEITSLLNQVDVYIVPIVNPDGYVYSWDVDRLWRKNRRPNPGGSFGVDNNRNWGFMWGGEGASSNPSEETYKGPFAFSEPETVALRDLLIQHPEIESFIDFHSYGQWVLIPWGWTVAPPEDLPTFKALGTGLESTLKSVNGFKYVAGSIYTLLYPASGGSLDWGYGDQSMWALSIELRDKGEFGFILPPDQIIPTCEENLAASLFLMHAVANAVLFDYPAGRPEFSQADDPATLAFNAFPIQDVDLLTGGTRVFGRIGNQGPFTELPVKTDREGILIAQLPQAPCGATVQYYVEAITTDGVIYHDPPTAPAQIFESKSVTTLTSFDDSFESNLGWTAAAPGDTATGGKWIRVDPNSTNAQPEDDHTPDGTLCFVTGQGPPGGGDGLADVDNGFTTLISPSFDGTLPGARLSYWRWYSNDQGSNPNLDVMPIEISSNGGLNWSPVELVQDNANDWVERSFLISDLATPTADMKVRFIAQDLTPPSLVEAGVDDFRVFVNLCEDGVTGDLSKDGLVDGCDLGLLLCDWDACGDGVTYASDLNGDGFINGADLGILLAAWTGK